MKKNFPKIGGFALFFVISRLSTRITQAKQQITKLMKGGVILLLPLFFFSCESSNSENDKPLPPKKNGHYLGGYLSVVDTIENSYTSNSFHYITMKGKIVDKGNLFEQTAKLCGDTSYFSFQESLIALSDTIHSIHITCNRDFDINHKTNEYLDDIVSLNFISFCEFINTNYENLQNNTKEKSIAEINDTMLSFIGPTLGIRFLKTPINKGEYIFTLSITYNNEKKQEIRLNVDFK